LSAFAEAIAADPTYDEAENNRATLIAGAADDSSEFVLAIAALDAVAGFQPDSGGTT
jgi:hypothetical protein